MYFDGRVALAVLVCGLRAAADRRAPDDDPPPELALQCSCLEVERPSLAATCGPGPAPFMDYLEALIMRQCDMRDPMLCYEPDLVNMLSSIV